MIFADKLIRLRKQNGMSQEELAERMGVSRQSVSKWEGAQSVPDLDKILMMSQLFGVSTDYLLKDEMEDVVFQSTPDETLRRRVTMEEANAFLHLRQWASQRIAFGTVLCILSPIFLFLMIACAENGVLPISSEAAVLMGLVAILILVAVAVTLFLLTGFRNEPYRFLEKEPFQPEYGVEGMVAEKQKAFRETYIRSNVIGVLLCVLSPVPLLCGTLLIHSDFWTLLLLCCTVAIVAAGVWCFVSVGVRWSSMQMLLQQGEYASKGKTTQRDRIATLYWLLALAVYLGWSFLSDDWHITWVVWPVAGILSVVVTLICDLIYGKEKDGDSD